MKRILAVLAMVGLGLLAFAGVANAQTTPSTTAAGVTSTLPGGTPITGVLQTPAGSTVAPGGTITIAATGLQASAPGNVLLFSTANPAGQQVGTATADATGAVTAQVTIPASTTAGSYGLALSTKDASGTSALLGASITVSGTATSTPSSSTPATTAATTTVPSTLPYNGPLATLPVIVLAFVAGGVGVWLRRNA